MKKIWIVLVLAGLLMAGCGEAFPLYPEAKSANGDEGMDAVVACGISAKLRVGAESGEQVELNPQSYSTSDSLATVKDWYKQNLTDWGEAGTPCETGVSYVFPKGCNTACDKQLYILDHASDGTLIVVITR